MAQPPVDRIPAGSFDHAVVQMISKANTPNPAWHDAWHLWRVVIPRRSITGKLVWGQVWRRQDRGQWIYKKVVEYLDGEPTGNTAP